MHRPKLGVLQEALRQKWTKSLNFCPKNAFVAHKRAILEPFWPNNGQKLVFSDQIIGLVSLGMRAVSHKTPFFFLQ